MSNAIIPMTTRRRILENAADVFHHHVVRNIGVVPNILAATSAGRRHCLQQLSSDLAAAVYMHRRDCDIDDPLFEMFEDVSFEALWSLFERFQQFVNEILANQSASKVVGLCDRTVERRNIQWNTVFWTALFHNWQHVAGQWCVLMLETELQLMCF